MSLYGYKPKWKKREYLGPLVKPDRSVKSDTESVAVNRRRSGRTRSAFRFKERSDYRLKSRRFVTDAIERGETCPVFNCWKLLPDDMKKFLSCHWMRSGRRSNKLNECHHKRGRIGALLTDERHWMAVSKWGHRAIHAFPKFSRSMGWLCAEGKWNTPDEGAI